MSSGLYLLLRYAGDFVHAGASLPLLYKLFVLRDPEGLPLSSRFLFFLNIITIY